MENCHLERNLIFTKVEVERSSIFIRSRMRSTAVFRLKYTEQNTDQNGTNHLSIG